MQTPITYVCMSTYCFSFFGYILSTLFYPSLLSTLTIEEMLWFRHSLAHSKTAVTARHTRAQYAHTRMYAKACITIWKCLRAKRNSTYIPVCVLLVHIFWRIFRIRRFFLPQTDNHTPWRPKYLTFSAFMLRFLILFVFNIYIYFF